MKLNNSFSGLPWENALEKIITLSEKDLEPILIVREDNPEKVFRFNNYVGSMKRAIHVQLGYSSPMSYLEIDILSKLNPSISIIKLPHDTMMLRLFKRIKRLPFKPVIVIDRCNHFQFMYLFRVIRLINELEGKALFIFILPIDYLDKWNKNSERSLHLNYFLRIVNRRYQLL